MPVVRLENMEDPRLRVFSSFTDGELRDGCQMVGLALASGMPAEALANGLFIAESRNVIERAMAAGLQPFALLVEECWETQAASLIERVEAMAGGAVPSIHADGANVVRGKKRQERGASCTDGVFGEKTTPGERPLLEIPIFVATRAQVKALTGFERTRGPLAAFVRPAPVPLEELLQGARRVAVLEGITNYTNIGAIFRSAAALGVDAVLLDPTCHDPLYRRAARVSMGTVFQVPWGRLPALYDGENEERPAKREGTSSEEASAARAPLGSCPNERVHLERKASGLDRLERLGFKTAALALTEDSIPIEDQRLKTAEKLALVLGNEEHGLSPATIAACDYVAKIPMAHGVDSLNVAAASAVAFWETRYISTNS